MGLWENLPIWVALPLAMTAAVMSGGTELRQEISGFFAEALKPQLADLGGDPGYLLGAGTVWPLPAKTEPVVHKADDAGMRGD